LTPQNKIYALENSCSKINVTSTILAKFPDKIVAAVAAFLEVLTNTERQQIQKLQTIE